ncbi:MAG: class I SAM-dependent methyltransferase [Candidatus Bathyarchaeota archaeon]|nr:class I SAM-dependent methyltransferase [Candidatus Bathyarchaeota archaeon]
MTSTLKQATIQHFAKRKSFYKKLYHQYPFLDIVARYYKPNSKTLEIGSGIGAFLHEISSSQNVLVGIDICKTFIHEAHKRFPTISLLVGDAEKLPFRSKFFKTVFMRNLLHHLVAETPNLSQGYMTKVLEETYRVCDKGGDLFVLEQCILSRIIGWLLFWFSLFMSRLNLSFHRINLHEGVVISFLASHQLVQLLEKTNFKILKDFSHRPCTGLHLGVNFGEVIIFARAEQGISESVI